MLSRDSRSLVKIMRVHSNCSDTYDNKMLIIQNHLEELLSFPAIRKECKADSIRRLVWHIQTHLSALRTLAQPVDSWDLLIMHLARKNLDFAKQRDWQNCIKDRTPENMPKLSEFLAFLMNRCHTIRVLEQSKIKISERKSGKKMSEILRLYLQ